MDGSPAGFYYSPPPSHSSNLWVIHLDGGGACFTEESCKLRAKTSKGSSNYWPKTRKGSNEWSDDPQTNPDFYMGHHVLIPYCSGDCHTGQRKVPSKNPDTWGFYFSGHLNFRLIIQYLADSMGFVDAQYVLFTGNSAGGLGVFSNINWLYDEIKQARYKNNITFKAAPMSGWFTPGNSTDQLNNPMMPPNDYPHWIKNEDGGEGHNNSIVELWDGYLIPDCVAALGRNKSWHCSSVHNLYPFIRAPIFVMENKYDKNQIVQQLLLPMHPVNNGTIGYVEYFGNAMDRSIMTRIIENKNQSNGVFYASCFDHGTGLGIGLPPGKATTINGYNSSELVGDWFWGRNKLPHFVYDTCNDEKNQLPCNPRCDPYPPN